MKIVSHKMLTGLLGCCAATLICSAAHAEMTLSTKKTNTYFQALLQEKPGFYPACKASPIRPRQENFQKSHLSLSGLTGVYLDVDGLLNFAGKKKAKLANGLKRKVAQRLSKGGLKLFTKAEMIRTPGQPEMNIYMTFPVSTATTKSNKNAANYRCCRMATWASFSQAAQIMRDPGVNYKFSTWGTGHDTTDCSDPSAWMSRVILETIDTFVADKLKGDADYAKWLARR
ncbi:MAG: hypothetical protein ACPGVP_13960 [Thiolinea sp.]